MHVHVAISNLFNTLHGMLTPVLNVSTLMECQHLCFKQENQLVRMNEQRTNDGIGQVLRQRFVLTKITFIFMKFEGCILSGIGTRSIPVSRQAG